MRARPGHCRGCHRPVLFADTEEGARVVLEPHEDLAAPGSFVIQDDGLAHRVTKPGVAHRVHACDALVAHEAASAA